MHIPCYFCICQNGVYLFLFYILSSVHKAINGFINKSVLVMRMRLLRKWSRKSLSSPASKINFVFQIIFLIKLLSLGISFHFPQPLSRFVSLYLLTLVICIVKSSPQLCIVIFLIKTVRFLQAGH